MLHSVIMAGGSGTRFWPLSRKSLPKQFLTINGERSLIQQAFDRCQPWIPAEQTWVVTGQHLAELTQQHLADVPTTQILKEPAARNTAPCVGLAAQCLLAQDPDAIMLVMPADHVIEDAERFRQDVQRACELVQEDPQRLVLFGVPPTYPATGFGYIERNQTIGKGAFEVTAFREKPNRETAESYLRAGTFFWNCGIFVWRADRILEAISQYEPELATGLKQLNAAWGTESWDQSLHAIFPTLKSISIDYAVLERDANIAVLEASFPWDDVGGWEAVSRIVQKDANGNATIGTVLPVDSHNCIIRTTPDHVIAVLDMQDCIVVHTDDATLVAKRGDDEAIRRVIAALQTDSFRPFL